MCVINFFKRAFPILLCLLVVMLILPKSLQGQPEQLQTSEFHQGSEEKQPVVVGRANWARGAEYPRFQFQSEVKNPTIQSQIEKSVAAQPEGVDLDVTYINRTPMQHYYCVQYPNGVPQLCPGTENEQRWPQTGEIVTFTAHVINKGTTASPAFDYKWYIDNVQFAVGTYPGLAAGSEATFTFYWSWAHAMDGDQVLDDHTIRFSLDPDDLIAETYETNNSIEDRTNGLALHIAITPEMVVAFNTPINDSFSYSAEDWLQRQVVAMNAALAASVYPLTPSGATERVRINQITITNTPPINQGTHDGRWFVDADYRTYSGGYDPVTDIDWSLVHELSHQIGLIDLYQSNIPETSVGVTDQYDNVVNMGFTWPRPGLMGGGDIAPHTNNRLFSSHSAAGLSTTKGYRRGYFGEYQYDIPQENFLLILDNAGLPARDVQVSLFQRNGPADWSGGLLMDDVYEINGNTEIDGRFLLPNRSVPHPTTTRTGHSLVDNPFGYIDHVGRENRFLVRLKRGSHEEFHWLDITAFNAAYWGGDTAVHEFTIQSYIPTNDVPIPQIKSVQIEGNQAQICWDLVAGPVDIYRVYRASPTTYSYELLGLASYEGCYTDNLNANRIYAVTAVDYGGNESGFSKFVWAPWLHNPTGIDMMSDGRRLILDPPQGLLLQNEQGEFIQKMGSPHYHLEYSDYVDVFGENLLLLNHPGDYYTTRHSVKIADAAVEPVLEFGYTGSSPGYLNSPSGVATTGDNSMGPYDPDELTSLLLHFDGNYDGAQGEAGTPYLTEFVNGRYDQGVLINNNDQLTYPSADNISLTAGSVEFWLKPTWDGSDLQSYTFFEVGNSWFNRLRIMKDGANNLRFMLWDSTTEYSIHKNVADWQVNEWHHIAVYWQDASIGLYIDGVLAAQKTGINFPSILVPNITIGSSYFGNQQADAVIDELRISSEKRLGDDKFAFLVADTNNHRIQAFDRSGDFVTTIGSFGSGANQFKYPEGIAVNSNDRIIVADKGNNRLQLLEFDGENFDFYATIYANLNAPKGITAYGTDRLIVSDSGNNQLKVLDGSGSLLAAFDSPNDGSNNVFSYPCNAVVDQKGNLTVTDSGNQRVVSIVAQSPELTIAADIPTQAVQLTWSEQLFDCGYEIYTQTSPYFEPDQTSFYAALPIGVTSEWLPGTIGDINENHFYRLRAINCDQEVRADSNLVGEFDFEIVKPSS